MSDQPLSRRPRRAAAPRAPRTRSRRRRRLRPATDRVVIALMVRVPLLLVLLLVWLPGAGRRSAVRFTDWDGIGASTRSSGSASTNYSDIVTIYPPFWPAVQHNLLWLVFLVPGRDAVRPVLRGAARQGAAGQPLLPERALPAGGAVAGAGRLHLAAALLPRLRPAQRGDRACDDRLARRPDVNIWAVLVAAGWRHVGYIMLLYLAGLRRSTRAEGGRRGRRRQRGADVLPGRVPGAAADQRHRAGDHGHRGAARVRHRLGHQQGPQRPGADLRAGHPEHRRRGQPDRLRLGAGDDHAGDLARCSSSSTCATS